MSVNVWNMDGWSEGVIMISLVNNLVFNYAKMLISNDGRKSLNETPTEKSKIVSGWVVGQSTSVPPDYPINTFIRPFSPD